MDVFRLRRRLVDDYGSYVSSFTRIRNDRIEEEVISSLGEGVLWSDPPAKRSIDTLLLDAAREPGQTKLTSKVRRALNQALNAEHNAGRLRTDWQLIWKPKK